jgi:hypothetical protein
MVSASATHFDIRVGDLERQEDRKRLKKCSSKNSIISFVKNVAREYNSLAGIDCYNELSGHSQDFFAGAVL